MKRTFYFARVEARTDSDSIFGKLLAAEARRYAIEADIAIMNITDKPIIEGEFRVVDKKPEQLSPGA